MPLSNKHVVVGVGGGIAAFKAVTLVRELGRMGATVRVAMTPAATQFVAPATFAALTGQPVLRDLFASSLSGEAHVALGEFADAMIVAPATMNLMARAAAGMANDAVLATMACCRGPVFLAPAMHSRMWASAATQRNARRLEADGFTLLGPTEGALASGESGEGRMREPESLAQDVARSLAAGRDLEGRRVLVSAGPTLEDLDDVRFLGNRSSGKMGFAVAAEARARGAEVTLVSGPTSLRAPHGVKCVEVRSALDMQRALVERIDDSDALIMAAAVADYRPAERASGKIKKTPGPRQLELVRNPDILAEIGATQPRCVLVGFAVESEQLEARARRKLEAKGLDLIVANHASVGFGGDDNQAILIGPDSRRELAPLSKRALAAEILDAVKGLLAEPRSR